MGEKQEALPGMERRDLPEIEQAAENYRKIRNQRCELSKKEAEAKATLIQAMKNKGRSYYSYNGLNVQLRAVENVKVKSKDEDDGEPIGTFAEAEATETGEQEYLPETDEPITDEERERLHKEAVTRWRRERREAIETVIDTEDLGGTPFPTEYSQEEINRMAEFCAAQKIAEEKPVKICYLLDQPHVITGATGSGDAKNWASVDSWSILPLENVGEESAKTYSQVSAEYYESDSSDPDQVFTYKGMKINCGSSKNPKWWVIVGSEQTFTVKTTEQADDFTAPRCDECHVIDGGHADTCSRSNRLTFDDYLMYAKANYSRNHQSYARKMELRRDPEVDKQVREWIRAKAAADVEAEGEAVKEAESAQAPKRTYATQASDESEKAAMRKDKAKRVKKAASKRRRD